MRSLLLFLCLGIGCSSPPAVLDAAITDAGPLDAGAPDAAADAGATDAGPALPRTIGPVERPARFYAPPAHDGVTPLPALVLLHGYGVDGAAQEAYFALRRATNAEGFYLVVPDGTLDADGRRFWNATPACCDFGATGVDDVAYLTSLLDALEAIVPVDPSAVFFLGHSNGGFMSFRMACELADRVAAIASLAGSDFLDDTDCVPSRPVSILAIHGDADDVILYGGTAGYPGAQAVTERWAARASCDLGAPTTGAPIDIATVAGAETTVRRYETGCTGAQAELWTIAGGAHIPGLTRNFSPSVVAWLRAHAR